MRADEDDHRCCHSGRVLDQAGLRSLAAGGAGISSGLTPRKPMDRGFALVIGIPRHGDQGRVFGAAGYIAPSPETTRLRNTRSPSPPSFPRPSPTTKTPPHPNPTPPRVQPTRSPTERPSPRLLEPRPKAELQNPSRPITAKPTDPPSGGPTHYELGTPVRFPCLPQALGPRLAA